MIRKTQVTYAASLTLIQHKVKQAVIDISLLKSIHAPHADAMKQVIVDIVNLQFFHRVMIHLDGLLAAPCLLIEV